MSKLQVRLRRPRVLDAPALAEEADDPRVAEMLRDYFPHPYDIDDALEFIDRVLAQDGPATNFIIEVEGQLAGVMGLFVGEDVMHTNAEIGYWLGRRWWGRGIGTAAVGWAVDYAWRVLNVQRVYAEVFGNNAASLRVLRKCGFTEEYRLPAVVVKQGKVLDLVAMGIRKGRK